MSEPHRRRRWAWITVGIIVVVLVAGLATFLVLLRRPSTRSVSVDEARDRATATGYGDDESATPSPLRPAAGVYRYRGEGTERLDRPPTSEAQGPDIPGTVTHLGGGCWRLRVDYNTNHWQSWDYCATDTGLVESGGAFFQRLDLVALEVETSSTYTCEPPAEVIRASPEVGDEWTQECRGTSTSADGEIISSGPYRYLGGEDLDIGGRQVRVLHYRRERALSGGQTGTEAGDVWFAAATGLLVRNERTIDVRSDSPLGQVTYHETGSFQLVTLTPTR